MFTGIVAALGTVRAVERTSDGARLRIDAGTLADDMAPGDSIAVDGVCLTAVELADGEVVVEAVPETLGRTTLGERVPGDRVNLERPLAAGGRFDGHIVQGHVDGVGRVVDAVAEGDGKRLRIVAPATVAPYVVEKGSIAVDGVSLTVAAVDGEAFEVAIIPHTAEVTTLGRRGHGDRVNLEADVLAKYVETAVLRHLTAAPRPVPPTIDQRPTDERPEDARPTGPRTEPNEENDRP